MTGTAGRRMDTAAAATLRAQNMKKLSKKSLDTREGPLRIRGFQLTLESRSLWQRSIYPFKR
jgi:hypothetical protein